MQTVFEDLQGKWALILGASSGFGAATAKALANAGMNICGVHLDRKSGMQAVEDLKSEIQKTGSEALFFNVNASDEEKRKEVLDALIQKKVKVHTLFHSLAFGTLKPFIGAENETIGPKQMDMTLDVMAHSLVYWTQGICRAGLFEKGGRIFAMTSAGSSRVWNTYGAVSSAKSSLESHIRQLSLELAPQNIACNAICAGVTDTPALRKIPGNEQMIEIAAKKNPYKRLTTPEDIAKATVALCLPHMSWMTGNTLNIDGGEIIVDG
ncbi:MAG: SDR family oxidoreductase [Bdellovibrionales bacterium]|nr:SDR family oxidoreductase [Bdellovibrionales bacterium]